MVTSMAIEQIAKTDRAKRATEITGDAIHVVRTARPDDDAGTLRCVVAWTFDLVDVTHDEIVAFATRSLVIDAQRAWRAASDRMSDAWGVRTISVRDMIDATKTRTPVAPTVAAHRASKRMSADEKLALIADLQRQIDDDDDDDDA